MKKRNLIYSFGLMIIILLSILVFYKIPIKTLNLNYSHASSFVNDSSKLNPNQYKFVPGKADILSKRFLLPNKIESVNSDPIKSFNEWSDKYISGGEGLLEGIKLAKERRSEMRKLISENPSKAISNQISHEKRHLLPDIIKDELEQLLYGRGIFE